MFGLAKTDDSSGVIGTVKTLAPSAGRLGGGALFAGADKVAKSKGAKMLPSAMGASGAVIGMIFLGRRGRGFARGLLESSLMPHAVHMGEAIAEKALEAAAASAETPPAAE